ncbi:unnamed protein product [Caenorhabditis sp. 36 PRJEB53466]|nr:unnamed protein product [Caenorhabditis sp. 36 PRJEB53466]
MSLQEQLAEARAQYAQLMACCYDAYNQNGILRQQHERLIQENQQLQTKVNNQNELLNNVQAAGNVRNQELKRMTARIAELEKSGAQSNASEINQLRVQLNDLTRQNQELKSKCANQAAHLNALTESHRVKNASILEDQKKISSLRSEMGKLKRSSKQAEQQRFNVMAQNNRLQGDMQKEKSKVEVMQRQYEETVQKIHSEHAEEVKRLDIALKESNEALVKLNGELKRRADQTSMDNCVKDLTSTIQQQVDFIQELKGRMEENKKGIRILQLKERNLTQELSNAKDSNRRIKEEYQAVVAELKALKEGNRADLEDNMCLICHCEMSAGEEMQLPKCNVCRRQYHLDCISTWANEDPICPVCRSNVEQMSNFGKNFNDGQLAC